MIEFEEFWDLYQPEWQFNNRHAATELLWNKCSAEKQQAIIAWLQDHRPPQGRNPYFFVQDFKVQRQSLSFDEYYKRFGTTEERDGWKRTFQPEQQKTIYVKGNTI